MKQGNGCGASVAYLLLIGVIAVVWLAVTSVIFMAGWNVYCAGMFGLSTIGYWSAMLGVVFLSTIGMCFNLAHVDAGGKS